MESATVHITKEALSALFEDCTLRYPEEACGLLGGRYSSENHSWIIEAVAPVANVHPSPQTAFEFDPRGWVAGYFDMQKNRQTFAGIYHSHPHAPPIPSQQDKLGIMKPQSHFNYWIISFTSQPAGVQPLVQPFRFTNDGFQPTRLVIA